MQEIIQEEIETEKIFLQLNGKINTILNSN